MQKKILLLSLVIFGSCQITKKSTPAPQNNEPVLFTVNNTAIQPDEFIYAYNKSVKNKGESEPVEDYLDLYINFKLKVEDAKKAGIDTTAAYQNELSGYLEDVKKPYLVTEKINEKLLQETYDRLQQEVNASHILIRTGKNPSPEDTLKAYNQIVDIKKQLEAGAPFDSMAMKYSEDPSASQNQGKLGWFTAFTMVYPFEDAAYKTSTGEISDIVKTNFGYHLIKVNDKRETSGRIKIAHIMLRFPPNASEGDSIAVRKEAYRIHGLLMEGEPWFAAATKYSQDLNTKDNGGSLPWFGIGNLPPSMEKTAFKLNEPEQISSPVKTPFGWHILKLEEKRGMASLESMEESLTRRIQRDERSALKISEVIEKLKVEDNFIKNEEVYAQLRNMENFKDSVPLTMRGETLFTIGSTVYTINNLILFNKQKNDFETAIKAYEKQALLDYEDENLAEKYPEYGLLAAEYRDGLLLFEIMSQKVWNRISTDSAGMRAFYDERKSSYKSPLKIKADVFLLRDTSSLKKLRPVAFDSLYTILPQMPLSELNEDVFSKLKGYTNPLFIELATTEKTSINELNEIKKNLARISANTVFLAPSDSNKKEVHLRLLSTADDMIGEMIDGVIEAEHGIFEADNLLSKNESPMKKEIIVANDDGTYQYLRVYEVFQPRQLRYEEAKGSLINDYQEFLENKWLAQLKAENKVVVNQEVLKKVKNQIEE